MTGRVPEAARRPGGGLHGRERRPRDRSLRGRRVGGVLEACRGCRGDRRGEGYEAAAGGAGDRCRDRPGDHGVGGVGGGGLGVVGHGGRLGGNGDAVLGVWRCSLLCLHHCECTYISG